MQYLGSFDTEEDAANARAKVIGCKEYARWYLNLLELQSLTNSTEIIEPQKPDPAVEWLKEFREEQKTVKENLLDGKYMCYHCGTGYNKPPEICVKCQGMIFEEIIVV